MRAAGVGAARAFTLEILTALGTAPERAQATQALASRLRVDTLLLLVRDPVTGTFLPAPGMQQTLRGGASWLTFIKHLPSSGRRAETVELPLNTRRAAVALVHERIAAVVLGGEPSDEVLREVERRLPLLSLLLAAEQDALLARAEAEAAKGAADRARNLAAALEAARAEAAALNATLREQHQRKDEFLAMLGHELRNPLSPLVTAIELLRKVPEANVPSGLTDLMARQTAQLTRLVNDLLDVARVSHGRIELKREDVGLADVLRDAVEESAPMLSSLRHHVQLAVEAPEAAVYGDRARLVQIFGNLLSNAAKYTDPGGRITVALACCGNSAEVRVRDNGIGIAPEVLPRIFDLFAQAPSARKRGDGGLGIGLTLVRRLVELHGGCVSARSDGLGRGSEFVVHLPLSQRRAKSAPQAPCAPAYSSDAAPRVLIVDDNRDAADSMSTLLRLMGCRVDVAYDGACALQARGHAQADVIFLDIGLPDMDGYELLSRMQPDAKPGARFIALTGFGTENERRRSAQAGFHRHIVKPAHRELLEHVLAELDPPSLARARG